jgi:acetyl esterase
MDVDWTDEGKAFVAKCDNKEVEFEDENCPDGKMKIIVHTPKTLDLTKKYKTIFWIHGGGFFLFTAKHCTHYACRLAVMNDCVVVSSFYQSPPEIRAPMYHLQSYYALKYTLKNADTFHIDSSRVCVQGESSGGMLTMAVAMELAKHDESHLIKYALADVPACSFEWFRKERGTLREIE